MTRALLLALFLLPRPAGAADAEPPSEPEPENAPAVTETAPSVGQGGSQESYEDSLARETAQRLAGDPRAAGAVAGRIMQSKIARVITPSAASSEQAFDDVLAWVQKNPLDAARLALGFARDDDRGVTEFEDSLFSRIERLFKLSPTRYKGIYGKLHGIADLSRSAQLGERLSDEQRRSMLKRFFEGKANETTGRIYGEEAPAQRPAAGKPASSGRALYDRLSASNPTGFSPQVMALQNQMNSSRPPGAPKLVENGKLGYDTLRYPHYVLRYDIDRLRAALKTQEEYASSRTKRSLDEAGETSFARRKESLSRAESALERFNAQAAKTKDPKAITPGALRALAASRRETALWITLAALQERLRKLELYRGFLSPPLLGAIARAPADEGAISLYRERGRRLEAALEAASGDALRAIALLRGPSEAGLAQADRLNQSTWEAARSLPAQIERYVQAPYRLLESRRPVSRPRALIDRLILALFPGTAYGRRLRARLDEEKNLREEFSRIAALR